MDCRVDDHGGRGDAPARLPHGRRRKRRRRTFTHQRVQEAPHPPYSSPVGDEAIPVRFVPVPSPHISRGRDPTGIGSESGVVRLSRHGSGGVAPAGFGTAGIERCRSVWDSRPNDGTLPLNRDRRPPRPGSRRRRQRGGSPSGSDTGAVYQLSTKQ